MPFDAHYQFSGYSSIVWFINSLRPSEWKDFLCVLWNLLPLKLDNHQTNHSIYRRWFVFSEEKWHNQSENKTLLTYFSSVFSYESFELNIQFIFFVRLANKKLEVSVKTLHKFEIAQLSWSLKGKIQFWKILKEIKRKKTIKAFWKLILGCYAICYWPPPFLNPPSLMK